MEGGNPLPPLYLDSLTVASRRPEKLEPPNPDSVQSRLMLFPLNVPLAWPWGDMVRSTRPPLLLPDTDPFI